MKVLMITLLVLMTGCVSKQLETDVRQNYRELSEKTSILMETSNSQSIEQVEQKNKLDELSQKVEELTARLDKLSDYVLSSRMKESPVKDTPVSPEKESSPVEDEVVPSN